MKKILLFSLLFGNTLLIAQEAWQKMGPDDFNQPSTRYVESSIFALDSQNKPYVVCQNGQYDQPFLQLSSYVKRFDGTKWIYVGPDFYLRITRLRTRICQLHLTKMMFLI